MNNLIKRGLPLLLTVLLGACTNPFFAALLGEKEKSEGDGAATTDAISKEVFLSVTGITGVPAYGTRGIDLTLTGTVVPANAANRTITWSVKNAGDTGANVSGNTLSTTGVGTVVLTAAIADGLAVGTAYTQEFSITIEVFTTPAQYRRMVLATPNASDPVTITGDSAYYYEPDPAEDRYKGVFVAGRTVILNPFKIAKYETTYELWHEVYQWATDAARGTDIYAFANAGREGKDGTDGAEPTADDKLEPVTCINWRDAVVWCNAYSEMNGKEPVYYTDTEYTTVLRVSTNEKGTATAADTAVMKPGAKGYQLPTGAEWEYAARSGGTPSTSGAFVDKWAGTSDQTDLKNYAWFSGNAGSDTHPVGKKKVNGLGLHDMTGNVWEWCWDWQGSIIVTAEPETNPVGPGSGYWRMFRGGSWYSSDPDPRVCAVPFWFYGLPAGGAHDVGFRVVCRD
jgi:formylglycine-generating enzyme required for sulfatase activity